MELSKTKGKQGKNNWTITGLTAGKIMAIENALQYLHELDKLSPVGAEVLEEMKDQQMSAEASEGMFK